MVDFWSAVLSGLFTGLGVGFAQYIHENKIKKILDKVDSTLKNIKPNIEKIDNKLDELKPKW